MIEYGIWSDAAGGIIEGGFYVPDGIILDCIAAYIEGGEDRADLSVVPVCADHLDQPANACHECEGGS